MKKRPILQRIVKKKLAKLEKNKVILDKKYKETKFKMEVQEKGDFYPLKVEHLSFEYQKDCPLFEDVSFQMLRGERYLIVGENGVGKSTFLKVLIQKLQPKEGNIVWGKNVTIGYYAQEHEGLDEQKSVLEQFDDWQKQTSFLRGVLGHFLFTGEDIYKKVAILSPGERS